jgi:hypothetical protein
MYFQLKQMSSMPPQCSGRLAQRLVQRHQRMPGGGGLTTSQLTPGLLRDYLEKRVPFGAKGMMFVEHAALDDGKTSLSWLLTGLAEPNFGQVQQTRARSSVKPFSRLSSPSCQLPQDPKQREKGAPRAQPKAAGDPPVPKKPRPCKGQDGGSQRPGGKLKGATVEGLAALPSCPTSAPHLLPGILLCLHRGTRSPTVILVGGLSAMPMSRLAH